MSAAEALKKARAAGIRLGIDGDDLALEASAPPPAEVLDLLARHKADIVTLLRPGNDGWSGEDWREFFEERAGIAEFDGGLPRDQAEARAFSFCMGELLRSLHRARAFHGEQHQVWQTLLHRFLRAVGQVQLFGCEVLSALFEVAHRQAIHTQRVEHTRPPNEVHAHPGSRQTAPKVRPHAACAHHPNDAIYIFHRFMIGLLDLICLRQCLFGSINMQRTIHNTMRQHHDRPQR
jgi:hypothetical protein